MTNDWMLGSLYLLMALMLVAGSLIARRERFAKLMTFALAWIADAILGDGAFGVLLNTTMLIVGAVIGTLLWRKFGYGAMALQAQTLALVATGSGIAMLIICGVLRRWI